MLQTTLLSLLFVLGLYGNCTGFARDTCTFHPHHSDTVYSVPGDVALLNSNLLSPDVFNFTSVPYNITWYDSTGREIKNQTHKILVIQEALWFLRITRDDEGEYVAVLRTPSECYTQNFTLKIDDPVDGKCGGPKKAPQTIYKNLSDLLTCPDNMWDYAEKLKSYNITSSMKWYKDCLPVDGGTDGYEITAFHLRINKVGDEHNNSYTCTLTFSLGGVNGSVSETISALVIEKYFRTPQVIRPSNQRLRAQTGSNFSQECLVFVPSVGGVSVKVSWKVNGSLIKRSSKRIYVKNQSWWDQTVPDKGRFFKRELIFSEVKKEDFHRNYVCQVTSDKAPQQAYFTLVPPEPQPPAVLSIQDQWSPVTSPESSAPLLPNRPPASHSPAPSSPLRFSLIVPTTPGEAAEVAPPSPDFIPPSPTLDELIPPARRAYIAPAPAPAPAPRPPVPVPDPAPVPAPDVPAPDPILTPSARCGPGSEETLFIPSTEAFD